MSAPPSHASRKPTAIGISRQRRQILLQLAGLLAVARQQFRGLPPDVNATRTRPCVASVEGRAHERTRVIDAVEIGNRLEIEAVIQIQIVGNSALSKNASRHGAQTGAAIRTHHDSRSRPRRQIYLPHGDALLRGWTRLPSTANSWCGFQRRAIRTPRVAHVAAQLNARRTRQRRGDGKRRSQILLRSPRKGLAVARRKLHYAGGVD